MKNRRSIFGILFILVIGLGGLATKSDWGFFGHRRINRMAVFTLPPDMMPIYKKNIDFLTDHAVDPDKRRYATKHEAVRHYIDIDHWGVFPFDNVPRNWTEVLMKYTDVYLSRKPGDTLRVMGNDIVDFGERELVLTSPRVLKRMTEEPALSRKDYKKFFQDFILPQYYEDEWILDCEEVTKFFARTGLNYNCASAFAKDRFSEYGILPYHLIAMQRRLTRAFEDQDVKKILRLSAEFGHYIGDAHVPLHTTENYNGQMTNQVGIHGFWESRIPELFADEDWDYFVGKSTYIADPNEYYWDIILTSHSYLDSVLLIEKDLSRTFPEDKQYCYDERLQRTIRTYCKEYAAAYSERMDGMVEDRMQASILAIGSAWFTAWVDAGQPDLRKMTGFELTEAERKQQKKEEELFQRGEIKGREH